MFSSGFRRGALMAIAASATLAFAATSAQAEKIPEVYANRSLLPATPTTTLAWGELKLESGAVGEIDCHNGFAVNLWNKAGRGEGAFEGWGADLCKAPQLEVFYEEVLKKHVTVEAAAELPVEYYGVREGIVCSEPAKTKLSECKNASERETREDLVTSAHRRVASFPWNVEYKRALREGEEAIITRVGVGAEGKSCYPTESVENEETGEHETVAAGWEKVPNGCVKIDFLAPQIPAEVEFYGTLEPEWINGTKNGLYASQLDFTSESGDLVSSKGQAPETEVIGELRVLGFSSLQLMLAK